MFTRVTRYLSAAVCAMGLLVAASANADDHGGRRSRGDSYQPHYDQRHHRDHDYDRDGRSRGEYRSYRSGWRGNGRYYPVRSVQPYWNYRCDDHRHYGYSHFHVPVAYYRSASYARYPYHGVYRDRGAAATVILSFPL